MRTSFATLCLQWFALLHLTFGASSVAHVRRNPIVLNVVKMASNSTSRSHQGRTKPQLFQQVLNLKPGKVFSFDLDKWRSIVKSGLFQNLTVNVLSNERGAYLNISGYERPSISLSPEITVTASVDNPQIIGGVSFFIILFAQPFS